MSKWWCNIVNIVPLFSDVFNSISSKVAYGFSSMTAFTASILSLEITVFDLPRPGRSLKRSFLPLKWLILLYTACGRSISYSLRVRSAHATNKKKFKRHTVNVSPKCFIFGVCGEFSKIFFFLVGFTRSVWDSARKKFFIDNNIEIKLENILELKIKNMT